MSEMLLWKRMFIHFVMNKTKFTSNLLGTNNKTPQLDLRGFSVPLNGRLVINLNASNSSSTVATSPIIHSSVGCFSSFFSFTETLLENRSENFLISINRTFLFIAGLVRRTRDSRTQPRIWFESRNKFRNGMKTTYYVHPVIPSRDVYE